MKYIKQDDVTRYGLRVNWWRCCSIEWATNTEYVKKVDKKNEHKNISVNKIKKEEISFSMFQLVLIIFCKNIPKKEKKRKNEISSTSFFSVLVVFIVGYVSPAAATIVFCDCLKKETTTDDDRLSFSSRANTQVQKVFS